MSGGAYLSTIDLFLFLGAQHQKIYALHHIITFRSLLVHKKRALHVVKRALSPGKRALYSCILAIEPCFLAKEPGISSDRARRACASRQPITSRSNLADCL